MEEETFFITEVDSDMDEKPLVSNTHNKVKSNGKSAISNNIESTSHQLWLENSRKRRKSRSVSMAEKKLLAKLVEKEPALWDKNNELHFHGPALSAAWRRISEQMSGRGVAECKVIWKSLRDAVRYRKNKIARTADCTDESRGARHDYDADPFNWEFGDCLSFLMEATSSITNRPQRVCDPMEFENSQTSGAHFISVDSTNNKPSSNVNPTTNEDTSASESSYTVQNKQQENDSLLVTSMMNMANNIKELTKEVTGKQDCCSKSPLKFDYIWRNLDVFFQKLPPEDVDELNVKFIQMAYERVKRAADS